MTLREPAKICIVPDVSGVGGMVSFKARLASRLRDLGYQVTSDLEDHPYRSVLVIGGTRKLLGLWRAKQRGVTIVQRLDGINWLHRRLPTGARHFLRAEYGNWLLAFIRKHLVDQVVYQSQFAQTWWERAFGATPHPKYIIHNGVDLTVFHPDGPHRRPKDRYRILLVEGSLQGGYEIGLKTAIELGKRLTHKHMDVLKRPVELMVVGKVSESVKSQWEQRSRLTLHWGGLVSPKDIPEVDRSAHLLFSADLNAACPNAVIEALACGLPVLAFDTGALAELVSADAGRIVPYGGDPWRLDPPDIARLAEAATDILLAQDRFRPTARKRAEAAFDLNTMTEHYLNLLNP